MIKSDSITLRQLADRSRMTVEIFMSRHAVIPAVHLFLIKDEQVLLLRRFQTGYEDGNYSVPAGHVDGDEAMTMSMIREAQEEANITIQPDDLTVVHVMHRYKEHSEEKERIDFFLEAHKWIGEVKNREPEKCDDLSWFSFDELPENIIPYVKSAIEQYREGKFYSEFGW